MDHESRSAVWYPMRKHSCYEMISSLTNHFVLLVPTPHGSLHRNYKIALKEYPSSKLCRQTKMKLRLAYIDNLMLVNAHHTWVIHPIWSMVCSVYWIVRKLCSNFALEPVLKQLGNGLVCDIGSGLGRDLLGVARAYPHLRIELHDKPETMSLARDVSRAVHSRDVKYSDTGLHRCGTAKLPVLSLPKPLLSILMICSVPPNIPKLLHTLSAITCAFTQIVISFRAVACQLTMLIPQSTLGRC